MWGGEFPRLCSSNRPPEREFCTLPTSAAPPQKRDPHSWGRGHQLGRAGLLWHDIPRSLVREGPGLWPRSWGVSPISLPLQSPWASSPKVGRGRIYGEGAVRRAEETGADGQVEKRRLPQASSWLPPPPKRSQQVKRRANRCFSGQVPVSTVPLWPLWRCQPCPGRACSGHWTGSSSDVPPRSLRF